MRSLATVIPRQLSLLRLLLGFTAELDELLSFCTLFFIVLFRRIGIASRRLGCSPEFCCVSRVSRIESAKWRLNRLHHPTPPPPLPRRTRRPPSIHRPRPHPHTVRRVVSSYPEIRLRRVHAWYRRVCRPHIHTQTCRCTRRYTPRLKRNTSSRRCQATCRQPLWPGHTCHRTRRHRTPKCRHMVEHTPPLRLAMCPSSSRNMLHPTAASIHTRS